MHNTLNFIAAAEPHRATQVGSATRGLLALVISATLALAACKPSGDTPASPASTANTSSAGASTPKADIPADAPASDKPQSEDLVLAVKDSDLAPPTADPRDFNGVWFPDMSYAPRVRPPYLPGKEPPPPKLTAGEAAASNAVLCVPSVNGFGGAGGGMVDLYVQTDKDLVSFFEEHSHRREIRIGAKHPKNVMPSITGDSVAEWDGDTLVVDTIGLMNEDIIRENKPRVASALHVTERIRKVRDGHYLEHQVTYDDPTQFVKPYTETWGERWRPDMDINENICEQAFDRFQIVDGHIVTSNTAPSETK